jgi:hypothetical protein
MLGMVIFSFAKRAPSDEPNPCNQRLGEAAARILATEPAPVCVVSQWEVARHLTGRGIVIEHVVDDLQDEYLDSEQVWAEARDLFQRLNIATIIPVAHPFLHLQKVRRIIKADGFHVERRKIGHVGFDSSDKNSQPWTKGPIRLLTYGMRQAISGHRGGK